MNHSFDENGKQFIHDSLEIASLALYYDHRFCINDVMYVGPLLIFTWLIQYLIRAWYDVT